MPKKDHLTKAEQTPPPHVEAQIETQAEVSITSVTIRALAENSPVAEKPQHEWGEVVVLVGTSTAGKTSIISELIKQKPGMVEYGVDLAFVNIPLNYLHTHHPKEMVYLERIIEPTKDEIGNPSYLLNYVEHEKKPTFKTDASISIEDKELYDGVVKRLFDSLCEAIPGNTGEEYAHSIVTRMMDEIILESKRGHPVACDILQINEVALNALGIQLPSVKLALVYVPFQTLAERVIIRNNEAMSEGNFGNARPGVFPLEQFTKLFRPKNDSDLDSEIVQRLTLGEVKHAIDTVFENSKSFLKLHGPDSLERLEKETALSRSNILAKFGFEEGDDPNKVVELTPSYKGYHMLINTAQTQKPKSEAVQEAVKQVLVKH